LKALNRAIDRFCYKHPRFGIPNLMIYIVIGSAIVFLFSAIDTTGLVIGALQFDAAAIMSGQIWRLVTFIIVPMYTGMSQLLWLAISLYFYYFIGSSLERQWGTGKFTIYYFSGVLLSAIYGLLLWAMIGGGDQPVTINMYYVNLSMFFAFATMFPNMQLLLFFFIPIKIKWLGIINAIYFLYQIIFKIPGFYKLLPVIAILNYLIFCGGYLIDYIHPSRARTKAKTINYKRAAKKVQQQMDHQPYKHKCAVCGKTDLEYPDMEFRYCSKCEGYHCFCMEHINNHVHFDQ